MLTARGGLKIAIMNSRERLDRLLKVVRRVIHSRSRRSARVPDKKVACGGHGGQPHGRRIFSSNARTLCELGGPVFNLHWSRAAAFLRFD